MRRLLVLALVFGVLPAGCRQAEEAPEAAREETAERTIALEGRGLALDVDRAALVVDGTRDSTATVRVARQAGGEAGAGAGTGLQAVRLMEGRRADLHLVRVETDTSEQASLDIRVDVPYKTPLRVEMETGTIEIRAIAAPIGVRLSNGTVQIEGAVDDLEVYSANGDLRVEMAGLRQGARVRLHTGNGSIDLTLAGAPSATVTAATAVGEIELDGLDLQAVPAADEATGARVEGVLGEGEGRIEVSTSNGTIRLKKGS